MTTSPTYLVAQLGARMHYAVPRILHAAGRLDNFYTDICAVKGWPRGLGIIPRALRPRKLTQLLDRRPKGIPPNKIIAFTGFGWTYFRRRATARTVSEATAAHLWAGKTFCELILKAGWGGAQGIYAFNSAALELLRVACGRGMRGALEQTIAPRMVLEQILAEERTTFPGWQASPTEDHYAEEYSRREVEEWRAADIILCGSEFVKESIALCGGPAERCRVVPYGVDIEWRRREVGRHGAPLRMLTIGVVGLRKGSPYILEAAKRLKRIAQFRLVGPVEVAPAVERELRAHVELLGVVPRSRILEQYAWADVFLLPSLCEGSATVTYEALAHGLPVICTRNTGSVVREGVDGYLVQARDANQIVERIGRLAGDRKLVAEMSENSRQQEGFVGLAAYADRLVRALEDGAST